MAITIDQQSIPAQLAIEQNTNFSTGQKVQRYSNRDKKPTQRKKEGLFMRCHSSSGIKRSSVALSSRLDISRPENYSLMLQVTPFKRLRRLATDGNSCEVEPVEQPYWAL